MLNGSFADNTPHTSLQNNIQIIRIIVALLLLALIIVRAMDVIIKSLFGTVIWLGFSVSGFLYF